MKFLVIHDPFGLLIEEAQLQQEESEHQMNFDDLNDDEMLNGSLDYDCQD